ncbi:hypothetical protein SRHO_G00115940 [Serrasalmus rhombeus]
MISERIWCPRRERPRHGPRSAWREEIVELRLLSRFALTLHLSLLCRCLDSYARSLERISQDKLRILKAREMSTRLQSISSYTFDKLARERDVLQEQNSSDCTFTRASQRGQKILLLNGEETEPKPGSRCSLSPRGGAAASQDRSVKADVRGIRSDVNYARNGSRNEMNVEIEFALRGAGLRRSVIAQPCADWLSTSQGGASRRSLNPDPPPFIT